MIVIALLIGGYFFAKPFFIQEVTVEETTLEEITESTEAGDADVVPTFSEVGIDFAHKYNKGALAFAGGSVIDVNGDGIEELFIGGGAGQEDALFFFENGSFVNHIDGTGLSQSIATYGSMSLDLDADTQTDLIVARENGVYLYLNENGQFQEQKLDISFASNTVPLSIAASDLNKDGWADLYISTFVDAANFRAATFNNPAHAKPNILLLNNGDNTFTDITEKSGLIIEQNTFVSVFVDLDNDGNQDLVAAPNTDTIHIFKNNGDATFSEIPNLSDYGFWMGLAVGDIDQDGDQDIYFSNIGNTIPVSSARGDLRSDQILNPEWLILENKGNFQFADVTDAKKLTGFEFAWGAVFEDFNLNGRQDLAVVENYIKWPAHNLNKLPARFFWQNTDGTFSPITKVAGVENPYYGMTPITSDFNQDGYPDLVYVNLDGPTRAFLNNGGDNHYVKVELHDNAESLGARVTLIKSDGTRLHKQIITGVGLLSDQAQILTFGVGRDTEVDSVEIVWPNGETMTLKGPVDSKIFF